MIARIHSACFRSAVHPAVVLHAALLLPAAIALTAVSAAHASASSEGSEGAFVRRAIPTVAALQTAAASDSAARRRYASVFSIAPESVPEAFSHLRVTRLSHDEVLQVYYVRNSGTNSIRGQAGAPADEAAEIGSRLLRLKRGTGVFALPDGTPLLTLAGGNPVHSFVTLAPLTGATFAGPDDGFDAGEAADFGAADAVPSISGPVGLRRALPELERALNAGTGKPGGTRAGSGSQAGAYWPSLALLPLGTTGVLLMRQTDSSPRLVPVRTPGTFTDVVQSPAGGSLTDWVNTPIVVGSRPGGSASRPVGSAAWNSDSHWTVVIHWPAPVVLTNRAPVPGSLVPSAVVPEPGAVAIGFAVLCMGGLLAGAARRRRLDDAG